jgi:CRP-like cAMP-binding protein
VEQDRSLPEAVPVYAPAASEDILLGTRLLRRAFIEAPVHSAIRDTIVIPSNAREPPALLIQRGVAYRSFSLPDGRRAIGDILLPTDIVGLDYAVLGRSDHDVIAANTLGYRALPAATVRELMRDPRIALRALALAAETRKRADRHLVEITRFDARGRIAAMILGVYERLRRQDLISRPAFNLPLTQEQIADHLGITMVHVSRTLRRMREERLVLVDRQVVIILDLEELRRAATGCVAAAGTADPAEFAQSEPRLPSES